MNNKKYISVQLVRSIIGRLPKHKATLAGLGLKKIHKKVIVEDTACTRGMINKISYLLKIESI